MAQFRHGKIVHRPPWARTSRCPDRGWRAQPPAAQRMAQRRSPGEQPHLLLGLGFFLGLEEVVLDEPLLVLLLELVDFEAAALRLAARAQAAF